MFLRPRLNLGRRKAGSVDPSITFTWDPENGQALPGGTSFTRASVKQEFDGVTYTELASGAIPEDSAVVVSGAQGFKPDPLAVNRLLDSDDFTTGNWTLDRMNADAGGGLVGLNSDVMTVTGTGGHAALQEPTSISTSSPYNVSLRAKAGTGQFLAIRGPRGGLIFPWGVFDLVNGILGGSNTIDDHLITDLGGDVYLCEITFTTNSSIENGQCRFAIQDTAVASTTSVEIGFTAAGETIEYAVANAEETFFKTPPIITAGASGTRNADVLDTGVVIPAAFSALLDVTLPRVIGSGNTITLLGPDTTVEDVLRVDDSFDIIMDDGGTPVTVGSSSAGARIKLAYGRDGAGRSASLDGATAVTGGAPGAGHEGENFELGSRVGINQSRCIHHLSTLYDERKSDAELETLAS